MKIEILVSKMMGMNSLSRLWHWTTDKAQHHTTYETFLTENETLTDSLVESALGNDLKIDFSQIKVNVDLGNSYDLEKAREELKKYRGDIFEVKSQLEESDELGASELGAILDDVIELSSKTLYLLKLS